MVTRTPLLPEVDQSDDIVYTDGDHLAAGALTTATSTGATLAGAEVTVCTTEGCATHTWLAVTSEFVPGIETSGYQIYQDGDTFSNDFVIINSGAAAIVTVAFNLVPTKAVFDTGRTPKAPNSFSGLAFIRTLGPTDIKARYSHLAEIDASGNQDTLGCLAIRFLTPLATSQQFRFRADTDDLDGDFEADPPPPPPPAVECRSDAPSPLGSPEITVGPTWAYAAALGPLGAARVLAWDDDFGAAVAGLTSLYVMDMDTPAGRVRVPISSWQATLRTGSQNYVQAVVPAALPWLDAIEAATSFLVSRRAVTPSGGVIEVELARSSVGSVQLSTGSRSATAVISGNSTGFALEPDPLAPPTAVLSGIRSTATSSQGQRIRCSVDWLLRPGQIADFNGTPFPVRFISYFVSTSDSYMDVAEQV